MEFNKVLFGSIGYLNEYKAILAKALLFPYILYFLMLTVSEIAELNNFAELTIGLLGMGVQTVIAITTHRVILLGPEAVAPWGVYKWSRRETFFALHMIGLALFLIPSALIFAIPGVGWMIGLAFACWVVGRLSLVFPSIAVDQGVTFRVSWKLTKNRQLLMFLVVVLFPILVSIPSKVLSFIPYSFVFVSIIDSLATVFIIAALSVTYKIIYAEEYGN